MKEIPVTNLLLIITLTTLYFDDSFLAQHLPILPLDIIAEILCGLPVKLLLQLRCVCKSWKSLISNPKFAKKHLSLSTACQLYFRSYSDPLDKYILTSYPLHSIFTNVTSNFTRLEFPPHNYNGNCHPDTSDYYIVGCCNVILSVSGDSRGNCPVRSSENGDFSPVKTGLEAKSPPLAIRGGDRGRHICPRRFPESAHILNYYIL
jgi:hypothetical protein